MTNPEVLQAAEIELRAVARERGAKAAIETANRLLQQHGNPAAGQVRADGVYYPSPPACLFGQQPAC